MLRQARPGEIQISRTVAQRVLEGGESVLFQDTATDGELNEAASVLSLNLRSIICVPLRGKSRIHGILYIDTDRTEHQYSHDDMLLSTAAGNSAGLAIENAQLHQQILESQRVEQEIEYAWIIQQGFLVRDWPEDAPGFEVYGETRPAKTVGGDFYDFIQPAPNLAGILIGDVSGKGVPAALTMAQLLAEFRLNGRQMHSPAEVFAALNDDLVVRSQRGMFCTLCYVLVDLETGKLRCANAGHLQPIRIGASGAELFGEPSGPPAGIVEKVPWQDTHSRLKPGDTVLLYTDGVIEVRAPSGQRHGRGMRGFEEYGVEALSAMAARYYGCPPQELVTAVNADVRRFCAPALPHDDCTLIALRYLGEP